MKEFITAIEETVAESDGTPVEEQYIAFKIDGRELHAYQPTEGQLIFMMAALGRGQTAESRFAAIINIMMASLRDEDADYFESRLLARDPAKRLPVKQIEDVFEYLSGEWFGRPTQPASGSAESQPSAGQN